MDDSILIEFVQHFDEIPLSNDDLEFPDLLGAAYEYLIKYFEDSAGKKDGEFYTPSEVVRMMVHVLEPQASMSVCDPCVGSGGTRPIQSGILARPYYAPARPARRLGKRARR